MLLLDVIGEVNWVQCDRCEEWFHLLCVGLAEDEVSEEEEYECFKCKQGRGEQVVLLPNPAHTTPTKSIPAVYGVSNFSGVNVMKPSNGMDSMLMCNENDVNVDNGGVASYSSTAESNGYGRSLLEQKGNSGMSSLSKLTQFSYETDESSQDEVKSSYSIGGNSMDSQNEQMTMASDMNMSTEVS